MTNLNLSNFANNFYKEKIIREFLLRNVYFHKNSPEGDTGRIRDKYKLIIARFPELEIYVFCILTSHISTCPENVRCVIDVGDYEIKEGVHPRGVSYINTKKLVTENIESLISYHKPPYEFNFLGKILQTKFNEIKNKCSEVANSMLISQDIKNVLLVVSGEVDAFILKNNI